MTASNVRISLDRPYVEEVEFVLQDPKLTEAQKQETLVFEDEVTFNRNRSSSLSEVIDNPKFKTTTAFNSRTDCSASGHVWRFAKFMHSKLTGG